MTNEENLEIQSTRYIAPRVMRLTSGRIAIIPMMGKGAPVLIDNAIGNLENLTALFNSIPSIDDLERTYYTIRDAHVKAPSSTPRSLQPTLDDLA